MFSFRSSHLKKKIFIKKLTQNIFNKAGIQPFGIQAGITCACKKWRKYSYSILYTYSMLSHYPLIYLQFSSKTHLVYLDQEQTLACLPGFICLLKERHPDPTYIKCLSNQNCLFSFHFLSLIGQHLWKWIIWKIILKILTESAHLLLGEQPSLLSGPGTVNEGSAPRGPGPSNAGKRKSAPDKRLLCGAGSQWVSWVSSICVGNLGLLGAPLIFHILFLLFLFSHSFYRNLIWINY